MERVAGSIDLSILIFSETGTRVHARFAHMAMHTDSGLLLLAGFKIANAVSFDR